MKYSSEDIDELIEWLCSDEAKEIFEEELKKSKLIIESAKKAESITLESLDIVIDK